MLKRITIAILLFGNFSVWGQIDYDRQYKNAKELFKNGKFNLAMESFKPLIAYDQNNKYAEYASFYYALAAYKQGYKAVAKDMFNQIKTTHPKWDKISDVNFWLGVIHFENGDYFQGLKVLKGVSGTEFDRHIEFAKEKYLANITDVETLRMMHEDYPKDRVIASFLARILSKDISDEKDRNQLEELVKDFDFERSVYFPEAPDTFKKQEYNVAVLLPFMVNTLEPTPGKKRNQIILDFYEGMKLALDSLNGNGSKINLLVYDTEQPNSGRAGKLLQTQEMAQMDLIVGPLYPEENEAAQKFALENQINIVHPFTNNSDIIGTNPHAFLFQPSSETLGEKAADFLSTRGNRKNTIVFYGTSAKDSVMADSYVKAATEKGLNVVLKKRVASKESRQILEILATPTEFDEFKYPIEFTLKKDSIGSIYVATDDPVIYSQVVGSVETRGDSIRVVGSENWIDDTAINPEKYQTLGIALAAPNFADPSSESYKSFFRRFVREYGRTPSPLAKMGYEFMMFFGNQLKENGVYFQEKMAKDGNIPGYLSQGFNYEYGRDNQVVPFITFKKGQLSLIEIK